MTAFASAILAALPGAGAQPEKAGTGATGGDAVLGVFEAMLAGMTDAITGGGVEDGKADAGIDLAAAQPDAAVIDPALAGASNVLPFAPLTAGLPTAQEEGAAATEVAEGASTPTSAVSATVVEPAVDSAVPIDGEQPAVSSPVAPTTTATAEVATNARDASAAQQAPTAGSAPNLASSAVDVAAKANDQAQDEAVTAGEAFVSDVLAEAPVEGELPAAPVSDASRAAAAPATSSTATATAAAATAAAAAAAAAAARPAETTKTQPVVGKTDVAPTAAADSAAAKSEQTATAVSSYLDGLDGAEPKPGDEVAVQADAGVDGSPDIAQVPVEVVETDAPERPVQAVDVRAAAASGAATTAEAPAASRTSAETVAKLSADIVRKLEGQSTKFDLQLDPHGLGKVDVSVEIDRDGRLTAALSFDSAQSASDLRSRSGELRAALEQAGFEVSDSGLSFDMASQGGGFGGREAGEQSRSWSGRAFQTAQSGLDEADARAALSSNARAASGGVDIRI